MRRRRRPLRARAFAARRQARRCRGTGRRRSQRAAPALRRHRVAAASSTVSAVWGEERAEAIVGCASRRQNSDHRRRLRRPTASARSSWSTCRPPSGRCRPMRTTGESRQSPSRTSHHPRRARNASDCAAARSSRGRRPPTYRTVGQCLPRREARGDRRQGRESPPPAPLWRAVESAQPHHLARRHLASRDRTVRLCGL